MGGLVCGLKEKLLWITNTMIKVPRKDQTQIPSRGAREFQEQEHRTLEFLDVEKTRRSKDG